MARVTLASQVASLTAQVADLQLELELAKRQLADAMTEKGALLNQLATQEPEIPQHFQESYAILVDERNELIAENQRLTESTIAAHERCDALEAIIAKPQAKPSAANPVVQSIEVDACEVIEVTAHDRRVWAKFQSLPREIRLAIFEFGRPLVGHLGIHNIDTVRKAWLESKQAA